MIRVTLSFVLCAVLAANASAGLYAHWPLDDGQGEEARNLVAGGEIGEIFDADFLGLGDGGSVWVEDDQRGTVIGLDGAFVAAGELPIMDDENAFSWTFWAKQADFQNSPANDIIIGNRWGFDNVDTSPREFIKFTPNRFEYHVDAGFASDLEYDPTDDLERHIPSDEEWYFHVGVKNGTELSYYRDAEFWNSHDQVEAMFSPDPMPFFMGGQDSREVWRGYLSDVQLYDHALTEAEIVALFAGVGGIAGDYNNDGAVDAQDIDLQAAEMKKPDPALGTFDENGDGTVDGADRLIWVKTHASSWVGDANLDSEFNSSDLVTVFTAGKYDNGEMAGWAEGDWDGDMVFGSGDLVAAFTDGGYELGPPMAAVPEPSGFALLGLALMSLGGLRRKS